MQDCSVATWNTEREVLQVESFCQVSRPKSCMHLSRKTKISHDYYHNLWKSITRVQAELNLKCYLNMCHTTYWLKSTVLTNWNCKLFVYVSCDTLPQMCSACSVTRHCLGLPRRIICFNFHPIHSRPAARFTRASYSQRIVTNCHLLLI